MELWFDSCLIFAKIPNMNAERLDINIGAFIKEHKAIKKIALTGSAGIIAISALASCKSKPKEYEDPVFFCGMYPSG
jgi:hypothetical protein